MKTKKVFGLILVMCIGLIACGNEKMIETNTKDIHSEKLDEQGNYTVADEKESSVEWVFEDGKLYIYKIYYTVIEVLGVNTCYYEQPWVSYKNQGQIKEIIIDADMVYTSVNHITQTEYNGVVDNDKTFVGGGPLFGNMSSLESITIKRLDLDKITDISYMFCNNPNLTNIDVSGLQTSNVTDVTGIFVNNEKMLYLDLENWNTSNFKNISSMLAGCISLMYLNVASWDTRNVEDFQDVFSGCLSLSDINLAGWTISDANVAGMFWNCPNLKNVYLPNVTLKNTISTNPMFDNRNSIVSYHFADGWDIYVEEQKQIWPIADECYISKVVAEPLKGISVVCIYYNKFMPDWYKESVQCRQNVSDYTNIYSTEQMDIWVDVVDREISVGDVLQMMLDTLLEMEKMSVNDNVIVGNAIDKVEIMMNASEGKISVGDIKNLMEMTEEELDILLDEGEVVEQE